ncbi:MAG: hypothetical protein ACOC2M_01930, partial [bacterium]
KVYQDNKDAKILKVLKESVDFSQYFVYPNGYYAGSTGSRNTLHFYPHGYEILGKDIPLAGAIAKKMKKGLAENKLVPPEIMSDRYLFYRVPEFLLSYIDCDEENHKDDILKWEKGDFSDYFERSRVFVKTGGKYYLIVNFAKGGVVKLFNRESGELLVNDCGIVGLTNEGKTLTSQWVDKDYKVEIKDNIFTVSGTMNVVPSQKLFSLFKNLLFRGTLLLLGWNPSFAHYLKGKIRKTLILDQKKAPVDFIRQIEWKNSSMIIKDEMKITGNVDFKSVMFGDEFFVRYVPQSRFFQLQELDIEGYVLNDSELSKLNTEKTFRRESVNNL